MSASRSYDVEKASFAKEIFDQDESYRRRLTELCGEDADDNRRCGERNGAIYEAILDIKSAAERGLQASDAVDRVLQQIEIEENRAAQIAGLRENHAQLILANGEKIRALTLEQARREKAVTKQRVVCAWGTAEPGTVAARRTRYAGVIAGKVRATWDIVWRVSQDVAPDWPSGDAAWEVRISGDPELRCRFDAKSARGRSVSLVTAMHAVNAIPAVIEASPGIKTRLDLSLFAGGYLG